MKKTAIILSMLISILLIISACAQQTAEPEGEAENSTGVPNPWTDVESAEEAAEGAGVDSFVIPEGTEIGLGRVEAPAYRCMNGIAQADFPIAAVEMTIRKGKPDIAENGDISGDYNTYKYEWTAKAGDIETTCYGNREGEATKTIWTSGDYCYCILARGAGGDDDFGLNAKDLETLIKGIK